MSSTLTDLASATASALSSAASSTASGSHDAAGGGGSRPSSYKVIGIVLAVTSGLLIGGSFTLKKMGLMRARKTATTAAGEGLPYLKSVLWWMGMITMIVGEICNVVAYAFADAILVTPMGSVAVVTSGVLAHFFLKERLSTFGWMGTGLCILGSIIIALNGPSQHTSAEIEAFKHLFIAPGFLSWLGIAVAASAGMIFWVAPRYGKTHMLVYIGICSLLGGLSVACTSGLGGSILSAIRGESSPWKNWFFYFLLIFCVVTLLLEVFYLNKALELFNTAMVTPVYFVIFTTCTLVTSIILNKGFAGSTVTQIITLVLGFLVICFGISLLQLSKIDPNEIKEGVLDRRSTVLLSAARAENDEKASPLDSIEDPGIDTIRGTAGVIGSVRRAISMRRSMSTMSRGGNGGPFDPNEMNMRRRGRNGAPGALGSGPSEMEMGMRSDQGGVRRYQLYDEPMPVDAADKISLHSALPSPSFPGRERSSTIKFAETDNIHRYDTAAPGSATSQHQHLEQPRLEGSHQHRDITSPGFPPLSASGRPTSPLAQQQSEGFSAARSGSLFSTSQYLDPYSDDPSNPSAAGGDFSPSLSPSQSFSSSSPSAQTFPRRQDSGGLGADGRSRSLAARLTSAFSVSNPDVASHDFASSEDLERGQSASGSGGGGGGSSGARSPPPSARGRFAIPGLGPRSDSGHRVAHPKGPDDLEAQESQALVGGMESPTRGRRGSVSSEEGDLGGRLETYDSRDVL